MAFDGTLGLLLAANDQLLSLFANTGATLPLDTDDDGALDNTELCLCRETDPANPDTDGDGLSDGFESSLFFEFGLPFLPTSADTDADSIPDAQELP